MKRHIVITGGNRGIGLELARQFYHNKDDVTVLCRKTSEELSQLSVNILTDVDVTDDKAVKRSVEKLQNRSVDILINNAGIFEKDTVDDLNTSSTKESILKQLHVNALAPLIVTSLFSPLLREKSKVILITSRMGSISDNTSGGWYGYRMSKAALNMASKSLARDFSSRGIYVGILHPGFVQTDMTQHTGDITVKESTIGLIKQIELLNNERSGKFYHTNGNELPW